MTISQTFPYTHQHTWFLSWELVQESQCHLPLAWWGVHWFHILCLDQGAQFYNWWNPRAAGHSSSHWLCSTPPLEPRWARLRWWSWHWAGSTGRSLPRRPAGVERWEQVALKGRTESVIPQMSSLQTTKTAPATKIWEMNWWKPFIQDNKRRRNDECPHNVKVMKQNIFKILICSGKCIPLP